jgi:ATP/maltotriose-dependent transcriptional regulator MalT
MRARIVSANDENGPERQTFRILQRHVAQRRTHLVLASRPPRRRIRIGQTRLLFREPTGPAEPETDVEDAPPAFTAREQDVLVALCRPLLARDMFTEPASTRTVADELVISLAAVKQHLANLFDKFAIGTHPRS